MNIDFSSTTFTSKTLPLMQNPLNKEDNTLLQKIFTLINILDVNKDGTPKKPKAKTRYLVFSSEKREEIKAMLEEEQGEAPKPKEVISKLGAVWKALSDEDKATYNDKAKAMAEDVN